METTTQTDAKATPDSTVRFEEVFSDHEERGLEDPEPAFGGEDAVEVDLSEVGSSTIEGDINIALETIHAAPQFDHANAAEIAAWLGSGIVAWIEVAHPDGTDGKIMVTNPNFDSTESPGVDNQPLRVDDTIPNTAEGGTLTYRDHPTGGPLFVTDDGWKAQHDDFTLLYRTQT
jgi:hypothetical protein